MERKYEGMIHYFTPEDTDFGPWSHSPQPFLHGERDLPGGELTAGFQIITAPVTLEDEPIFHREEETMFFLGAALQLVLDLLLRQLRQIICLQIRRPFVQAHAEHDPAQIRRSLDAKPGEKPGWSILPDRHGIEQRPVHIKDSPFSHSSSPSFPALGYSCISQAFRPSSTSLKISMRSAAYRGSCSPFLQQA